MDASAFLIDMDGVIFRGTRAIPEAVAFIDALADRDYLFVTNNSAVTPGHAAEKLRQMGIRRCDPARILTSATATADCLHQRAGRFTYFAVGGRGLHESLSRYGTWDDRDPDFVVVGEGEGLDYETLTTGINILLRGKAQLIGTNPDASLDGTRGGKQVVLPGGGALAAPFHVASGLEPEFIGKPGPVMFQQALDRLNRPPSQVFMIGDRPETDVQGGAAAGLRTILVCTGRFGFDDPYPENVPRPDIMVRSLAHLPASLLQTGRIDSG